MKQLYRKQNVYSFGGLLDCINANPSVSPVAVGEGEFYHLHKMQTIYMYELTNIKKNHIFEVRADDWNTMYRYEYEGAPSTKQLIIRPEFRDVDWTTPALQGLTAIPRVGIRDIKWIELYDKWRPLIPVEHRRLKYVALDPGPTRRDKVSKHREEAKKQREERSKSHGGPKEPKKAKEKKTKKAAPKETTAIL